MAIEFSEQNPPSSQDTSIGAAAVLSRMKAHPEETIRKTYERSLPEIHAIGENVSLALTATTRPQLRKLIADKIAAYKADPNVRPYWEGELDKKELARYAAEKPKYTNSGDTFVAYPEQELNVARLLEAKIDLKFDLQGGAIPTTELVNDMLALTQSSEPTERTPDDEFADYLSWEDRKNAAVLLTRLRLAAFGQQQPSPFQNFKARMNGIGPLTALAFETMFPDPLAMSLAPQKTSAEAINLDSKIDALLADDKPNVHEIFTHPPQKKASLNDIFSKMDAVLDNPEDLSA